MGVYSLISCKLRAIVFNSELSLLYSNATQSVLSQPASSRKALSLNLKTSRTKEPARALNCLFQGLFFVSATELGTEDYTTLICLIPATRHYSFLFHSLAGSSGPYSQYFSLYTLLSTHLSIFLIQWID